MEPLTRFREATVLAMLFILLVAVGNFVLGFALAVHLGHGPAWVELSSLPIANPARMMNSLRTALRGQKR
jgi:hypothetical protein